MRCVVSCGSTSFPWLVFFFESSAVRVHDSQAYRKMDVTRERISRSLELREILLSIQTGFSLVNAAVGFVHAMDLCTYEIVLCLLGGEGGCVEKKTANISDHL